MKKDLFSGTHHGVVKFTVILYCKATLVSKGTAFDDEESFQKRACFAVGHFYVNFRSLRHCSSRRGRATQTRIIHPLSKPLCILSEKVSISHPNQAAVTSSVTDSLSTFLLSAATRRRRQRPQGSSTLSPSSPTARCRSTIPAPSPARSRSHPCPPPPSWLP